MQLGSEGDPLARQVEALRRGARQERFAAAVKSADGQHQEHEAPSAVAPAGDRIVGRSTALFRPYVRLRSAPDPETVRPEKVLRASLRALLDESTSPPGGWADVREQLWSIRQDLSVQHLHCTAFAAEASLEGARLAVHAGDVAELHRCLVPLVANGACAGRVERWPADVRDEVLAFRLLYLSHGGLEGRPGRLEGELLELLRACAEEPAGPSLRFARRIHAARASGNWALYWRLAAGQLPRKEQALDRCRLLVRLLAPAVRLAALAALARALPQGLSAERACGLLGLDGAASLRAWLVGELRLEGDDVLPGGRLACDVIGKRIAEQSKAAAAAAREAGATAGSSYTLMPGVAGKAEGEAAIWRELEPFAARHAAVLRAMESKALQKAGKKIAKKERKQEKKRLKKLKKKMKKERKRAKKTMKKLKKQAKQSKKRSEESSSSSSNSSNEEAGAESIADSDATTSHSASPPQCAPDH